MTYKIVKNKQSRGYDIVVDGKVVEGGFFSKSVAEAYAERNYSESTDGMKALSDALMAAFK
jgi:hypothetical protein